MEELWLFESTGRDNGDNIFYQENILNDQSLNDGLFSKKRYKGSETWLRMPNSLLSKEAKMIISNDPNLSDTTMQALSLLQNGEIKRIPFYFGKEDFGEESDVGCALLSSCIKDEMRASWAEIIARYAALRKKPFVDMAFGLKEYHRKYGMFYFSKEHTPISWSPMIVRVSPVTVSKQIALAKSLIQDRDTLKTKKRKKSIETSDTAPEGPILKIAQ